MRDLPTKGRFRLEYRGTECLNCGHPLDMSDRFCPNCAQANSMKKISVRDYWEEFMGSFIAYDSRLFRTLYAMLFSPGRITTDFVAGKRMRFTNPFRFLLSLGIIYFLMLSAGGNYESMDGEFMGDRLEGMADADSIVRTVQQEIERRDSVVGSKTTVPEINLMDKWAGMQDSVVMADPVGKYNSFKNMGFWERAINKLFYFNAHLRQQAYRSYDELTLQYQLPQTREDRMLYRVSRSLLKVSREPGSFMQDLLSKLPFATFFFLPVFCLFLWLAYVYKNYTYTDNLIFCFHNQSALFILLILSFLVDSIFGIDTAWLAFLGFAFYLYKAMRHFYRENRFLTILKFILINTIFVFLSGLGALLLILGSVFTY